MSEMKQTDQSRRDFFTDGAKLAAAVTLAPGVMLYGAAVHARPADQAASSDVRWGMLVDTTKCSSDCNACVSACQQENGWGTGSGDEKNSSANQKAQWIRKVELRNTATGHVQSLPMMCQHCENPPCVDVCPSIE